MPSEAEIQRLADGLLEVLDRLHPSVESGLAALSVVIAAAIHEEPEEKHQQMLATIQAGIADALAAFKAGSVGEVSDGG